MKMRGAAWALAGLAAAWAAAPARAVDVGVSVTISQPGVYGRIDIGKFPQPQVVVAQPVVIRPVARTAAAPALQPVYLWVPPGHQKNWRKHCDRYNACGVPVYFVRDDWYQSNVMAGQPSGKGKGHGHDKAPGKGHGQGRKDD
jgi:hypothetical protein